MKKLISLFLLMTAIMVALFANRGLVTKKINKGIEFSGGLEILTRVENKTGVEINMTDIAKIIAKRIDVAGVKNPQIDIETGKDEYGLDVQRIRTTLAGIEDDQVDELTEMITSQGLITFRDVNDRFLAKGTDFLAPNGASLAFQNGEPIVSLKVHNKDKIKEITGILKDRNALTRENLMIIWVDFDAKTDSYKKWALNKRLEAYGSYTKAMQKLQAKVISAASVTQELTGDIIISGGFTIEEARSLASYINTGSIEYKMIVEETNQVNGAFGEGAFQKAVLASKVAAIAVGIFMMFIYGLAGVLSFFSLMVYLFAVLATFNWLGGEYGPDTIAAMVIGFGMAADASIILFERFKDELLKGRNLSDSFDQSSKKSLSSIIDANITTFIVAFVLFQFGSRTVKGFAIMLSISIFWTIIIVVLLTRFNLNLLIKSYKFNNKKHLFGVKKKHIPETYQKVPNYKGLWWKIDFVKSARKFIAASLMIIGIGLVVIGSKGTKNSIQFTGGTRISVHTDIPTGSTTTINNALKTISKQIQDTKNGLVIENIVTGKNKDNNYILTFNTKTDLNAEWNGLKQKLENTNEGYKFTASSISSSVAKDTVRNAITSMGWAIMAIIAYVTVRFKWTYALSAIVALLHDALIVYGLFAILRLEVTIPLISAILAIIGYSINDTIVSFDRIREKMEGKDQRTITRKDLINIVNVSIRQTATRSLFTTITTMIAVLALLFIGPSASIMFNIAMLFGLIAGTYSSIWIASNVWIALENFRLKKMKLKVNKPLPKIAGEPDENIYPEVNY